MTSVFVVHHSYMLDRVEETKFIGVYSRRLQAQRAVKRLSKQPGFKRLKKYFFVDDHILNRDSWSEGFVTSKYVPLFSVWKKDRNGNVRLVQPDIVEEDALRLIRTMKRRNGRVNVWMREHA